MSANEYYCKILSEKAKEVTTLNNENQMLKAKLKNYSAELIIKFNYKVEQNKINYQKNLELQQINYDQNFSNLQQQYLEFIKELTNTRKELVNSFEINKKLVQKNIMDEILIEKLRIVINSQKMENIPLATEVDIEMAKIRPPEPLELPPSN